MRQYPSVLDLLGLSPAFMRTHNNEVDVAALRRPHQQQPAVVEVGVLLTSLAQLLQIALALLVTIRIGIGEFYSFGFCRKFEVKGQYELVVGGEHQTGDVVREATPLPSLPAVDWSIAFLRAQLH